MLKSTNQRRAEQKVDLRFSSPPLSREPGAREVGLNCAGRRKARGGVLAKRKRYPVPVRRAEW